MNTTTKTATIYRLGNAWTADGDLMPSNVFRTRQNAEKYARKLGYTCKRTPEHDADGVEYQFDAEQFDDSKVASLYPAA